MDGLREQGACPDPKGLQFVLSYKRLDAGTFRVPAPAIEGDTARLIDERAFDDLIDGIDIEPVRVRGRSH